jgi:glycosyltransferase involved in cell wall biosynthesis
MKVSIIVPVYNEAGTVAQVLERLKGVKDFEREIVVVDDGSTDGTADALKKFAGDPEIATIYRMPKNSGKGAAVRAGIGLAKGDVILIQDADLELYPEDLPTIVAPFSDPKVTVVYGSRFLGKGRLGSLSAYCANMFLVKLTNLLYWSSITDMETCYKAVRADVLKNLNLVSDTFDIEPEITGKLLRSGHKIHEVPVRYEPRTTQEGKKINWKHGVTAVWNLLKWRVSRG